MKSLLIFSLVFFKLFSIQTFSGTEEILTIVNKYLPKDPIIVEAGAFYGTDSVKMATKWPEGKVFSFEPVPELYQKLISTTKNIKNITTYQQALGQSIGDIKMYLSEHLAQPGKVFASSSLLPPKEHLNYAPHIKFPKTIKVPVTTLDAWANNNHITHVDFMWLDMQGYELNTLKASPKILDTVKAILTEVVFVEAYKGQYQYQDIKKHLEKKGFKMIALDKRHGWFGDALFVKKNLL